MSAEEDAAICKAAMIAPEQLFSARQEWARRPIMRKVLEAKLEIEIAARRNTLETADAEKIQKEQGAIIGLRTALGIISHQAKP